MLHYRILSWAQFKVLIKRRHILAADLKNYDPELLDSDALNQVSEFKARFSLTPEILSNAEGGNSELFEWVNRESGGLLLWACLIEGARDYKTTS